MYRLLGPALMVLLFALVAGCGGDDDGGEATPAPEEATATPAGTTSPDGNGESGGTFTSSQLPISVTVTVPDGWEHPSDADLPDLFVVIQPPDGFIDFVQPTQVYNRPTETTSELADPPADYVAWFNENALVTVLSTEPTTIGNLQGTRLEIKNDSYDVALFKLSDGFDYEVNLSDHVYIHILDVGETQIIVSCGVDRGGDFAEFAEECDQVLSTVEFGT